MKCPRCQASRKYRDGMNCPCGYRFALDPKQDGCTDGKFLRMVHQASMGGTSYFTLNQLHTACCRKHHVSPKIPLVGAALGIGAGMIFLLIPGLRTFLFGAALFVLVCLGMATICVFRSGPTRQRLEGWLDKYEAMHGPLERLLRTPQLDTPPPEWPEPDIYDYGVERLIVVQHDLLVDLLVFNDVHASQRALVISGRGYPEYLLDRVVRELEENEQLPVFFLHDATQEGAAWVREMQESESLPWHHHPKVDLGMAPQDMEKVKRLAPLHPERVNYALPVDALPWGMLAAGLGLAVEQQASLGALLATAETRGEASTSSFG